MALAIRSIAVAGDPVHQCIVAIVMTPPQPLQLPALYRTTMAATTAPLSRNWEDANKPRNVRVGERSISPRSLRMSTTLRQRPSATLLFVAHTAYPTPDTRWTYTVYDPSM